MLRRKALLLITLSIYLFGPFCGIKAVNPEKLFKNPPPSASPGVLWMWMGTNLSKEGITKDLESLKKAGFNRTTMFSLSDVTTPWAGEIKNNNQAQIVAWTEPWWEYVKHAASESKRLGMEFGMFNCPGYESSGGKWIKPEYSMQELCWSEKTVYNTIATDIYLEKPKVDLRSSMPWPIYNPLTGKVEKPKIDARNSFYEDITVLAIPVTNQINHDKVVNLTGKM